MNPADQSEPPVRYCRTCGNPDQDLGLRAMRRAVRGSAGYYNAMSGWAPPQCECAEPDWETEDD